MGDTRERIIASAAVLFARQGYAGTSLREITETAGVNIAAVNYHFGSKEGLLIEILDRVVGPLNARRLSLLDEAESTGVPGITEILTAFLRPDVETLEQLRARDPSLPRFVSRMYSEDSEMMARVLGRQFAEIQKRFMMAFSAALPELDEKEIGWRLHCIVGVVIYLFSGVRQPGSAGFLGSDIEANLERLLTVAIPIMTAEKLEVLTR